VRVEVAIKRLGDALDVERGAGATGDDDGGESGLFLFERDVEELEFLEQGIAGLAAMILMGARGERLAGFAPDPHPRLLGSVAGKEDDEMLEAGFGKLSVKFESGSMVRKPAGW